jgi:hypothetical protein
MRRMYANTISIMVDYNIHYFVQMAIRNSQKNPADIASAGVAPSAKNRFRLFLHQGGEGIFVTLCLCLSGKMPNLMSIPVPLKIRPFDFWFPPIRKGGQLSKQHPLSN